MSFGVGSPGADAPMTTGGLDLHTATPSVYLDQWVWFRLAKAAAGEPREPTDVAVLEAVRDASAAGVAFPLSTTHYMETSKITDPAHRARLARTMASVSRCRTLRSRRVLLRHQMLYAMHLAFGRPAFRPTPPEALGAGVIWAFTGKPGPLTLRGPSGRVDPATIAGMPQFLRKANQFGEFFILAGPADEELEDLRQLGYRPEASTEVERSRLAWERTYVGLLADDPLSRAELRVRVQARELLHEHLDLFTELVAEYHVNLTREVGYDPARPHRSRKRMVAFADLIPSLRIAVDLKTELFRDAAKAWTMNAVHDIDALSMAVPYCHVVVCDAEMAHFLARAKTGQRHGTAIVPKLADLPASLSPLMEVAQAPDGDQSGWEWASPGDAYCVDMADLIGSAPSQSPAA